LVLIVPTDRSSPVQRLQDLARPEIRRIAMGRTATVPAGRYARQAIDALRLWPALQQKIVFGDSVRAVLQAVASGDVDAGFVYATDVPVAGQAGARGADAGRCSRRSATPPRWWPAASSRRWRATSCSS
ncbi:MAG: molybdate ABC transporter substrate-binding protein, partial [Betaproteobacteria bacterium]|nr:molybdate ABC transporter substrate-binding protein [Betaproteobacteria bacterium]